MITLEHLYHITSGGTLTASLVGVLAAVFGLRNAMAQQRVAYLVGNGARLIISAGHVRTQGVILSAQAILFLIAVVSWSLPTPPLSMPVDVVQLLVLRKVLRLGLSLLLCLSTLLDWRDRSRLEPFIVRG